jgi:hypothetical protein
VQEDIMSLSLEEHCAVSPIAWSLRTPEASVVFMREVERVLGAYPTRGEGLAYRIACEILPRYFVPPPMPVRMPDHYFNVRRIRLRR